MEGKVTSFWLFSSREFAFCVGHFFRFSMFSLSRFHFRGVGTPLLDCELCIFKYWNSKQFPDDLWISILSRVKVLVYKSSKKERRACKIQYRSSQTICFKLSSPVEFMQFKFAKMFSLHRLLTVLGKYAISLRRQGPG